MAPANWSVLKERQMLPVFLHERLAGVRSSGYALAGIQPSAALSERAAYSYQYPGFRFAPPWAEVSYAFGVPPENAQFRAFFTLTRYPALAGRAAIPLPKNRGASPRRTHFTSRQKLPVGDSDCRI